MKFDMDSYIYFCNDMKTMLDFYTRVMRLRLTRGTEFSVDEWAEFKGKGFKLCLHKAGKPGSPPRNRNKLVFEVADVGAARDYLVQHKVKMGKHMIWPNSEACDGRDPEGNKFQIAGPRLSG